MNITLRPADAARTLFLASLRTGTFRGLGGAGSGNFGHEGRPGEVGGSGSGGGVSVSTTTTGILAAIQKADGGFTYNPITGHSPTSGYALSLHKDRERVLSEMNVVTLAKYAKDNEDLLSAGDNYLGGWHNPEDGKFYLDVSTVVNDAHTAERLGREHHQLAYFDLSKGQSVFLGEQHVKAATHYRGRQEEGSDTRRFDRAFKEDDWSRTYASRDKRGVQDLRTFGGVGSGNFGHAGRKGEVGGSGEGGREGKTIGQIDKETPGQPSPILTRDDVIAHHTLDELAKSDLVLYHGTSSAALNDIKINGLVPGKGKGGDEWWKIHHGHEFGVNPNPAERDPVIEAAIGDRKASVFLGERLTIAQQFAKTATEVNPGSEPVILKVRVPKDRIKQLTTDEGYTDFMGNPYGGWRFKGKIEPKWIEGKVNITNAPTPWDKSGYNKEYPVTALEDNPDGSKTIYIVVLTDGGKKIKTAGGADMRLGSVKDNTPLHHAADKHEAALSVAVRYAFAKGRAVVPTKDPNVVARAVRKALLDVLPGTLAKVMSAGGETALKVIGPKLKAAGDVEGHPFHGNQWTVGNSTIEIENRKNFQGFIVRLPDNKGWIHLQTSDIIGGKFEVKVPPGFAAVTNSDVRTTGIGDGFKLYKEALGHLHEKGFQGIASDRSLRNDASNKLWKSFEKHGAKIDSIKVGNSTFDVLRHLSAEMLRALADPIKIRFDNTNPDAAKWAKEHATELADNLSNTTRDRVANALEDLFNGDATLDDVRDAVGDDTRADIIARTEAMTAVNEGQRQGWDQAVEAGLLDENAKRTWIATFGCCDDCDELDGEETTLDGEYPDPGGDGPPLHPNCRCTEGISG